MFNCQPDSPFFLAILNMYYRTLPECSFTKFKDQYVYEAVTDGWCAQEFINKQVTHTEFYSTVQKSNVRRCLML